MYRHKRERRKEAKSGWSPLVFLSPGIFPSRFILLELPFLETTGKHYTEVVIHPPKVKRTKCREFPRGRINYNLIVKNHPQLLPYVKTSFNNTNITGWS